MLKKMGFKLLAALSAIYMLQSSAMASDSVEVKLQKNIRNAPKPPSIKILLAEDRPSIMVEAKGSHNIYDPYTGKKLESAFSASSYMMIPTIDGIKWGEEFPGIYQILIIPDSQAKPVSVQGIQYPGAVSFYLVGSNLAAVNWLTIEDFTKSILSCSFLPKDREYQEAIAAYAIVARTVCYEASKSLNSSHFWNIRSADAQYKGKAVERLDAPFVEAMNGSKNIILSLSDEEKKRIASEPLSTSLKRYFDLMPTTAVENMADRGDDAQKILEHFFPNHPLVLIGS